MEAAPLPCLTSRAWPGPEVPGWESCTSSSMAGVLGQVCCAPSSMHGLPMAGQALECQAW